MNRRQLIGSTLSAMAAMGSRYDLSAASPDNASAQRSLSEHRIAKIETKRSNDRYSHFVGRGAKGNPFRFGFGRDLRILVTDQGVRGGAMSGVKPADFKKFAGRRVSDLYDMETGTIEDAMSIDLPLHDLVGKILQLPVYKLLGAKGPIRVPIYSSNIHFEDLEPWGKPEGVSRLLRECQVDYDLGYRAFKVKIGRGMKWMPKAEGEKRDIEITRAVRERYPDCKLIIDANNIHGNCIRGLRFRSR